MLGFSREGREGPHGFPEDKILLIIGVHGKLLGPVWVGFMIMETPEKKTYKLGFLGSTLEMRT